MGGIHMVSIKQKDSKLVVVENKDEIYLSNESIQNVVEME
jgi:hypothetical protein